MKILLDIKPFMGQKRLGTAALLHKLGVGDITTPWTQVCECSNSRMGLLNSVSGF